MNKNNFGVIMAGGIGARFWPLSTKKYPKQFHDILGTGRTLLQSTFDRLKEVIPTEQIFIITLKEYRDLVLEQIPEIGKNQIVLEPYGMNTAPCNLLAAKLIYEKNEKANIIVAPSDHIIMDKGVFIKKIKFAVSEIEEKEILITLGIQPIRPETGYGYIQFHAEDKKMIKKVKTFTEKPNEDMAKTFLKSGDFLWNSGIFVWKASTILNSFHDFLPEMYETFDQFDDLSESPKRKKKIKEIYAIIQRISIDHAILEKAENVYVIPSSFGWTDLGTFKSLYELSEKNKDNNVTSGKYTLTFNSKNSLIYTSEKDKAIVVDGLEDYIVVNTEKALLICPMDRDQTIKVFVNDLRLNKGEDYA